MFRNLSVWKALSLRKRLSKPTIMALADKSVEEQCPPVLGLDSQPPILFYGTVRLYVSYICPFAQRAWITRNYKGLQDTIKLVPIDLNNKPTWYKEKVYPPNKVPSLEHDGKVIGESLDVSKYIDKNFEGPFLFPEDPAKKEIAEELLAYTDKMNSNMFSGFKKGDPLKEADDIFDYLENTLQKFDDGPFFLGQFSLVDIAYVPFIERYNILLSYLWKYDFAIGRPKLVDWFEEMNKIQAYKMTRADENMLRELLIKLWAGK
ncbi:Glutathione S-transferase L3 [Ancistrocladus abbreviatus]